MPGLFDPAHCDDCGACEPVCTLGNTTSLNTNVAGSWTYTGGSPDKYSVATANALRISSLGTDNPWKITANIHHGLSISEATKNYFRLIGGYLDSDNYYFAEYRFDVDGVSNLWAQHIIGQKVAGVETFLAYDPYAYTTVPATFGTRDSFSFDLCWTGFNLRSRFGTSGFSNTIRRLSTDQNISSCPGEKFGIATGSEMNTTAEFRSIELEHNIYANEDCEDCLGTACDSTPPDTAVVRITNEAASGCCRLLNGTYTLTRDRSGDMTYGTSFQYGWDLTTTTAGVTTNIQLYWHTSFQTWVLEISRILGGCAFALSRWSGVAGINNFPNCQTWTAFQLAGGGFFDLNCGTSVTAEVKLV